MKKNGIEIRKNGNEIHRRASGFGYDVYKLNSQGELKPSINGPWDYLGNARVDADSEHPIRGFIDITKRKEILSKQ